MARARLRLFADEGVPASLLAVCRARGHQVELVVERLPRGSPDGLIARAAEAEEMILLTWCNPTDSIDRDALSWIDFRGEEAHARQLGERYMPEIERAASRARRQKLPFVAKVIETAESELTLR